MFGPLNFTFVYCWFVCLFIENRNKKSRLHTKNEDCDASQFLIQYSKVLTSSAYFIRNLLGCTHDCSEPYIIKIIIFEKHMKNHLKNKNGEMECNGNGVFKKLG